MGINSGRKAGGANRAHGGMMAGNSNSESGGVSLVWRRARWAIIYVGIMAWRSAHEMAKIISAWKIIAAKVACRGGASRKKIAAISKDGMAFSARFFSFLFLSSAAPPAPRACASAICAHKRKW